MQDIIIMSNRELHCVEILQKLIDKRLTEHEAAKQLDLSVRQIRRLKKAYKVDGAIGIVSKKRGKPSNHRYPDSVKELAITAWFKKGSFGVTKTIEDLPSFL